MHSLSLLSFLLSFLQWNLGTKTLKLFTKISHLVHGIDTWGNSVKNKSFTEFRPALSD